METKMPVTEIIKVINSMAPADLADVRTAVESRAATIKEELIAQASAIGLICRDAQVKRHGKRRAEPANDETSEQ